jgi:hypothetical protein
MANPSEISFGFYIRWDEDGVMRAFYQRKKLPVEVVMSQVRALLNNLERPYFDNFDESISSTDES